MRSIIAVSIALLALAGCQAPDEGGGDSGRAGQALFSGGYELQNWTSEIWPPGESGDITITPGSGPSDWAEFSYYFYCPTYLPMRGFNQRNVDFSVPVDASGEVSFDWEYTVDHGEDFTAPPGWGYVVVAFWVYTRNGTDISEYVGEVQIMNDVYDGQTSFEGSVSIPVEEGDELTLSLLGGNRDSPGEIQGTLRITNFRSPSDVDSDGVSNDEDACPDTPEGAVVDASGCSIAQLCPCDDGWRNHGRYVSCVAHAAEQFLAAELISEEQKDAEVSAAARTDCGRNR